MLLVYEDTVNRLELLVRQPTPVEQREVFDAAIEKQKFGQVENVSGKFHTPYNIISYETCGHALLHCQLR